MTPAFDEITPHPDGLLTGDLEQIHERAYVVRSYRRGNDTLILRGAVRDQKPAGLYIPDDPEPLTVHHMVVDLEIAVPSLEIRDAKAVMEVHPHTTCPRIEDHYRNLIGLSIARGFTHRVRELFGGPRGCTHTTALLQAMGPVAVQSIWSFRVAEANRNAGSERGAGGEGTSPFGSVEGRQRALAMNLNTCHVWAEDGPQVRSVRAGEPPEIPVWIVKRLTKLGRDVPTWPAG